MNGRPSPSLSPVYTKSTPLTSEALSDTEQAPGHYLPKQKDIPSNGMSSHEQEHEGAATFKLREYKMYYHFLYLQRKQLKEARKNYSLNPNPPHRLVVHRQEQDIVKVCLMPFYL